MTGALGYSTDVHHFWRVPSLAAPLAWVVVGLLALLLGRASAAQPLHAVSILLVIAIGWLVATRRLTALVPLATLTLAWGTSTLPFTSLAFPAKFAMLAAIAATTVPWLLSGDRHLPVSIPFTVAFGVLVLFATMSVAWSVVTPMSPCRRRSRWRCWEPRC